ncbi:hypothetical protein Tco_1545549, partial [Tanacetum coccineum]
SARDCQRGLGENVRRRLQDVLESVCVNWYFTLVTKSSLNEIWALGFILGQFNGLGLFGLGNELWIRLGLMDI